MTSRHPLSTLGVILALSTCTGIVRAQGLASTSSTPTVGFADAAATMPVAAAPSGELAAQSASPATSPAASVAPALVPYTASPAYTPPTPEAHKAYAAPSTQFNYRYVPPAYYASTTQPAEGGSARLTANPGNDATSDRGGDDDGSRAKKDDEHFRIGVLGGVGFPRPLAIEAMVKVEKMLGLGLEYSALPDLSISGVETSYYAVAGTARFFPFKDAFFIGLRVGRQHVGGDANVTIAPYGTYKESVTVDSTFLNPRIGFLWTWSPGFTVGIDAGIQVPVGATVASSLPAGTQVDKQVMDIAQTLGNSTLPTLDLLKLGILL